MSEPFVPNNQGTKSLSVTTTSGSTVVALDLLGATQLEFTNDGSVTVFVRWGLASVGAATVPAGATGGSYPVGPGAKVVVSIGPSEVTHACAITASSTATLYITPGRGQ